MTQTQARYGAFAEWCEQWSRDMLPLTAAQPSLLPAVTGDWYWTSREGRAG